MKTEYISLHFQLRANSSIRCVSTVHQHLATRCHQSSPHHTGRGPEALRSYPSVTGEDTRTSEFLPEHNLLQIQWSDIQTETRSSHGITSVAHNSKPIYGRIRGDRSPHSPQPHPSVWFRYVYDTFTVIHEYHIDEFTTHLNSLDYNIKFTTEPGQDGRLPFLDACANINEDGSTHVIVYGKLTNTDQYLNFSSNHHLQHKSSVVRTLMRWAEVMVTRPDCRRKEMAHVQDSLKTNEYKQWMFKVPTPKQQQSITSTRSNINVGLPCMQGTSEALTRVFKAHGVGTYHRHIN